MRLRELDLFLDALDAMVELIDEDEGLEADKDNALAPIPVKKVSITAAVDDWNTGYGSPKA